MSTKRRARRRDSLWARDPRCKICKVVTIKPSEIVAQLGIPPGDMRNVPDDLKNRMATLDHEVWSLDPMRQVNEGRERTRLLCYKCNTERGEQDNNSLPIEVRRMLSSNHPSTRYNGGQPV